MPDQDGLRFLFDIQDKITAKVAKIEARATKSAAKIDKAFTRASKSQQANTSKAIASEQRRVVAVEKSHAKAVALLQRESDARSRSTAKTVANEQKRIAAVEKSHARANALRTKEATKATQAANRTSAAQIKAEQKRIVAVEKSHNKAIALIKREGDAFKRSMGRLAASASVAFAAVAGKAIQMAGGYDLAMRSVQAKTGATGELMDRLSEQSREMGRTTVHSATEAARGQAFLAQAGFDANQVLEALPATLALATSGELDLASAADIASNVLSGFRLETDQTARVTDVLAKAADSSNTNVAQLGAALAKAAPSAAAAGWSLEETAAAIGKLSDAGIQGEEAGTALKTMMAKLAIEGGPAEKLMAKMGITVKDTTGQMLPLNDILTALAPHANDVGVQFELLGTRGGNAGLVLGAVAQDARALTDELIDSAGWAQKNADIMSGGLWGAIKAIQSIIESAYISFGKRFTPAIQKIAIMFAKLPAPIQEVVVVVGSLAGAMGGLMVMMPGVFGALTNLPGKLTKLTTKIGTTTLSLNVMSGAIKGVWRALMGPVGLVIAIGAAAVSLGLFWRESQKVENRLPRLAGQIENLTARIEKQGKATPRQTVRLNKLQKSYNDLLATTRELPPQLTLASIGFEVVEKSAAKTKAPIVAIDTAAEALTETIEDQSAKLDHWGLQLDGLGKAVEPIPPFMTTLTGTIEDQSAAADHWGLNLEGVGVQLDPLPEKLEETEEAGMSFGDAMRSISGSIGGAFKRVYDAVSNVFTALAKGDTIGAIIAASMAVLQAYGSAIDKVFNGAEMRINDMRDALDGVWDSVDSGALSAAQAWERMTWVMNNTETGGAQYDAQLELQQLIEDTGRTAVEAERVRLDWTERWNNASTDAELKLLTQERARWAEEGQAVQAQIEAAEEAAKAVALAWENTSNAAVGGFRKAEAEGVKAYNEIMKVRGDYVSAVDAGDDKLAKKIVKNHGKWVTSHDAALDNAVKNQADANAEILQDEGEKYAMLAAFDAAMALGAHATAAERAEAADMAATSALQSWDAAMTAVIASDQAATDAMFGTATETSNTANDAAEKVSNSWLISTDVASEGFAEFFNNTKSGLEGFVSDGEISADEIAAAMAGMDAQSRIYFQSMLDDFIANGDIMLTDSGETATGIEQFHEDLATKAIYEAERAADQAIIEAERLATGVGIELNKIPTSRTVDIRVNHHTAYSYSGDSGEGGEGDIEGRQHGGPVSAGQPYFVGEAGRELFVPSRSGRIEPNGSIGGGGVDAKEIAKAVADAIHGTKMEVDGRQFARLVVRHHQTAVAELGGRR